MERETQEYIDLSIEELETKINIIIKEYKKSIQIIIDEQNKLKKEMLTNYVRYN